MSATMYRPTTYEQPLNQSTTATSTETLWLSGLTYRCDFMPEQCTWEEAKAYLETLNQKSSQRWRLPTLAELERLLTPTAQQNLRGDRHHIIKRFLDCMPQESIFWSSTKENSMGVWVVDFSRGYYCLRDKTSKQYLLCVSDSKLA